MANSKVLVKSEVIGELRRRQEITDMELSNHDPESTKIEYCLKNQKVIMDALLLLLDGRN